MTKKNQTGKLRIGDNWNAITIIALSQNNPLKAIAEFVENSIDANAKHIRIIRGKEKNTYYLKIIDDGEGVNDFKYVATHIGDSIKRQLKKSGMTGIQGEFGIGLLSFWTVGEELQMTSCGTEGITRQMTLVKGNPGYSIKDIQPLFQTTGTELLINGILPGVKQMSGEKIQNYLASELRDRISKRNVEIRIIDKAARKELLVEPRKFKGILMHHLPELKNPFGEIYYELYFSDPSADKLVGLYKQGTRVLSSLTKIDQLHSSPWNSGYFEGMIDADFLQLTPGTRDGIIYDEKLESFLVSLEPLTAALEAVAVEHKHAEEDTASKNILTKISKAMKEALAYLPSEEYSWLDVSSEKKARVKHTEVSEEGKVTDESIQPVYVVDTCDSETKEQREFFEIPGNLYSAKIHPSKCILGVGKTKKLQIKARDKKKIELDGGFQAVWTIKEGEGILDETEGQFVSYVAADEPGISIITCEVSQGDIQVDAEAIITTTEELLHNEQHAQDSGDKTKKGLPGYTYKKAAGELWRSYYDIEKRVIVINNGHSDFIYASRIKARKLRYIAKLFAKELVLANFPEATKEQLMERMIELQLYAEENL